ncbi:21783_t:CDS:2, partial [Gigaspora margarita]
DLEPSFGKEIGKVRPVLILSNNQQNLYSPLEGKILTDQITAIDKERLGDRIEVKNSSELLDLAEKALHKVLGFKN